NGDAGFGQRGGQPGDGAIAGGRLQVRVEAAGRVEHLAGAALDGIAQVRLEADGSRLGQLSDLLGRARRAEQRPEPEICHSLAGDRLALRLQRRRVGPPGDDHESGITSARLRSGWKVMPARARFSAAPSSRSRTPTRPTISPPAARTFSAAARAAPPVVSTSSTRQTLSPASSRPSIAFEVP